MNKLRVILLLIVAFSSSCAPTGLQYLQVPELPEIEIYPKGVEKSYKSYVYIKEIDDARPSPFFVKYKATAFEPASSISPVIRDRIATTLEKKNFVISNTAPIILSAQVRTWEVKVGDSAGGGMRADAELSLEVLDPTGARMFSGVYRGYATYSKIALKEKIVSRALSRAMGEAVKKIFEDQDLSRILSSF